MWNMRPCSKIIYELEDKKKYLKHYLNLKKIEGKEVKVSYNKSKIQSKVNCKFRKLKENEIKIKNKKLLIRLKNITKPMRKIKKLTNISQIKNNNYINNKILKENLTLNSKINSAKSFYNQKMWNQEYIKHLYYKKNISENARRLLKFQNNKNICFNLTKIENLTQRNAKKKLIIKFKKK